MSLFRIFTLFFILFAINIKSQNSVWFLNGDKIQISSYNVDTTNTFILYKNKRNKEKAIDIDNIFSITDSLGNEKVFYSKREIDDSLTFSVKQMRSFVQGGYDADKE